jgi:ABC-type polysaccharide/polyol phosphate transport system ATPase subunit
MNPAVLFDDVTKEFRVHDPDRARLKSLLLRPRLLFRPPRLENFVALNGVSLQVEQGETFGIIGRNGAGKSTMLALIGGILRPTRGHVRAVGRICPLLHLGVGFSQELSGRENAVLNGILLGLRRHEAEANLDAVIEFAEIGRFIDQPLKTYSTGMQMRLGFSIAVHAEPDLLLIDEALSVGDAEFSARCLERIVTLKRRGVTIVFVSHDLSALESICDRAVQLEHGRVATLGVPKTVISNYMGR